MLAVPIFRARVAPVFDWCSKIVVVPEDGSDSASGRQIDVAKGNGFTLVQSLREQGVKTLICGALSPEILNYGESIGLKIIPGVAGEIDDVLRAYHEQKLDQPQYWLPGCRGYRRYRRGAPCACSGQDVPLNDERLKPGNKEQGRSGKRQGAGRVESFCICPVCGARVRHERGIPCVQLHCPACRNAMIRE